MRWPKPSVHWRLSYFLSILRHTDLKPLKFIIRTEGSHPWTLEPMCDPAMALPSFSELSSFLRLTSANSETKRICCLYRKRRPRSTSHSSVYCYWALRGLLREKIILSLVVGLYRNLTMLERVLNMKSFGTDAISGHSITRQSFDNFH